MYKGNIFRKAGREMSDLISHKELLKKLKEYVETVYECDFDDPHCTADGGSSNPKFVEGLWEAKEIIEDLPTAYDVDKVVEDIRKCGKSFPFGTWHDIIEEAVEIVKGGLEE
jgi:hypothetical protein